jgi:hypothetical protein
MTNIRASGFDSKNELQEHLLELVPEASTDEPVGGGNETEVHRAAELELAWLRKEVTELQEQFSQMGRKVVDPQRGFADIPLWLKIAAAAAATCALGSLIRRL